MTTNQPQEGTDMTETPDLPHTLAEAFPEETKRSYRLEVRYIDAPPESLLPPHMQIYRVASDMNGEHPSYLGSYPIESLAREVVKHTPHLRLVPSVEHAPEALEVLTNALGNLRAFHGEHNNRKVAKEMLAKVADAGMAVVSAGEGEPTVEQVAHVIYLHGLAAGPFLVPGGSCTAPACEWSSEAAGVERRDAHNAHVAEEIHALYAGRAPEGNPEEESGPRLTMYEPEDGIAEIDDALWIPAKDYDEKLEEVANLRDALGKAEALIGAQMDGLADDVNGVGAKVLRAMHSYAAARQALTEGATNGESDD